MTDQLYGARVVISPTLFAGSAGGIAFLGAFSAIGTLQKPTFVFTTVLGNDEKFIAEAASHEVGHNLGLSHDGIVINGVASEYYGGHSDWMPIMGAGVSNSISQWSKGEYPGATNLQDDIAILQTFGIPIIADDHGNTIATATSLIDTNINASGLITTRDDEDVFQFITGNGDITINLNQATVGGNLDLHGTVYDAQGTIVAFIFNQGGLSASNTITLPAGVYYLLVDGMGDGLNPVGNLVTGYSDYGSLGQYTVTGMLVANSSQPPIAAASATPTSGTGPLNVTFSSAGSNDTDGTIVSYSWNFGGGTTAAFPSAFHTYTIPGTYTATLTVTDNAGATATNSLTIEVKAAKVPVIYVNSIVVSLVKSGNATAAKAVVTVYDNTGAPHKGVTVKVKWSGLADDVETSVTNAKGRVTFISDKTQKRGKFTVTVTKMSTPGSTYIPSQNKATSASIFN